MRRSHSYYEVTLFTPVILIASLSIVGIMLPVDSGEKKTFSQGCNFCFFKKFLNNCIFLFSVFKFKHSVLFKISVILYSSITILLALLVYIDYVQQTIPVWPTVSESALVVWLFIVSIIGKSHKF